MLNHSSSGTGAYEELHLHLFELAHAEDELTGHDFVAERLADLCDAEGDAHAAGFLHVEVVDEDALGCFGAQKHGHGAVGGGTHLGFEHEVELAHVGPVLCAADGVDNLLVDDDLAEFVEVVGVHGVGEALMQCVAFCLMFKDARVCLAEHGLVKALAETFCGFGHFFFNLIVDFLQSALR